tara:strand:- start:198 stop:437 length:240 start_codon:yes stop_codon:yes gene_type:complete
MVNYIINGMLLNECIISKYGTTCLFNNGYSLSENVFKMENLLMYIILRPVENIIRKSINNINFADISINIEDLDNVPFT